ncbi:iron-sulfur cluster repair di-iron protein [Fervidibacillus albus]|uniref:Iron-sulfur cluster repair di-iron protein n=1 Tax=Fervidibacillus albus TaxID=2980026 RepID=A0A9E8LTH1_9BACI|nr:iron-sulfur cluster repair di-iron protein [Fervidibacillus albus]WAA09080.1 iron-sulfur cluster repair di-iron protein [Fervidibacillus albus]
MTIPFSNKTFVKDIVNELPKAADIFRKNRIDYCCGGNIPLEQAAMERAIDLEQLMQELVHLYETTENAKEDLDVWTDSDSKTIIDHIQNRYHEPLKVELAELSPYVTKVARVHGEHHPELLEVYDLFYELKKELLDHTTKEDEETFPLLLQIENNTVENKEETIARIAELEKEHDHAGNLLKQIRNVTNDFSLPEGACNTYRLVYKRLEQLEKETFQHIHLENNILFPRFID